ncbi:MAG: hypothetical protein HRT45_14545 [Bdellovibrionales bacterium]|nr:hypothetical protein [Bdellovibrionales bacterium]
MKWSDEWLKTSEERVAEGDGQAVADEISRLERSQVPDVMLVRFARLCRRVGDPLSGAKSLFSAVKAETSSPLSEQVIEYACCLARLGRGKEAVQLLESLAKEDLNDSALEVADIYFNVWDYKSGIKVLENALSVCEQGYRRRILELNHLASMVALSRLEEASELGHHLVETLKRENSIKLLGNCYELLGQVFISTGNWPHAKKLLNESVDILSASGSLSSILPKKWLAIGELRFEGHSNRQALTQIEHIKNQARQFRHWESLRHIDLQVALHLKDSEAFSRIYFTCPHPMFRELYMEPHLEELKLNSKVTWSKGNRPSYLDLTEAICGVGEREIKPSQVLFKMLSGLASDYYNPLTVHQLHQFAFEGQYFNPLSSPDKTHKAIIRLRKFIDETLPSLLIDNNKNYGYRLRANDGLLITYPLNTRDLTVPSESLLFVKKLQAEFGSEPFSRKQVDEKLGYNSRKSGRKLLDAVESGDLQTTGNGRSTRYKIVA